MWNDAIWEKGNRRISGRWFYYRASDQFTVVIDLKRVNSITGNTSERFTVYGEKPEWFGWKEIKVNS